MSFDRKNKRAAQQALRDAQASAHGHSMPPPGSSPQSLTAGSGLSQTLLHAENGHASQADMTAYYLAQREHLIAQANARANGQPGDLDGVFGSPDSVGRGTPATSPHLQARGLPHDMAAGQPGLHFATIARGPTATFVAPAASGLSHHFGSPPTTGRSSVAAQAMLSEQARRLSSTSESLSPPRLQQLSRARAGFGAGNGNGTTGIEYGSSPPLAVPGMHIGGGAAQAVPSAAGIFGTSPFSSSRGLFMPSSYDSNEDGFPRSPPVQYAQAPGNIQRSASGASWRNAIAMEDAPAGEDDGEDFDEGFLPSSLNDLLTPEEMRRRTLRAQAAPGASHLGPSSLSSRSAFDPISNSVPADLLLATGKPTQSMMMPAPTLGERSMSAFSPPSWPSIGSSSPREAAMPIPGRTRESTLIAASPPVIGSGGRIISPTTASLLSSALSGARPPPSPGQQPFQPSNPHLAALVPVSTANLAMYSASFSDASMYPMSGLQHSVSPTVTLRDSSAAPASSDLAAIAVPGSLPTGLAAGLSRLHLVPPAHTGETPPSQTGSYFGGPALSSSRASASPTAPFGLSSRHDGPPDSGVGLTSVGSPLRSKLQDHYHRLDDGGGPGKLAAPEAVGQPHSLHHPGTVRRVSEDASAKGKTEDEDDRHDEGDVEIQFDMEVA